MASAETLHYTVLLEQGDDGWITVYCPALPGCVSQGRTRQEALANIREAIELYVESLRADGEPIPHEDVESVDISLPLTSVGGAPR